MSPTLNSSEKPRSAFTVASVPAWFSHHGVFMPWPRGQEVKGSRRRTDLRRHELVVDRMSQCNADTAGAVPLGPLPRLPDWLTVAISSTGRVANTLFSLTGTRPPPPTRGSRPGGWGDHEHVNGTLDDCSDAANSKHSSTRRHHTAPTHHHDQRAVPRPATDAASTSLHFRLNQTWATTIEQFVARSRRHVRGNHAVHFLLYVLFSSDRKSLPATNVVSSIHMCAAAARMKHDGRRCQTNSVTPSYPARTHQSRIYNTRLWDARALSSPVAQLYSRPCSY